MVTRQDRAEQRRGDEEDSRQEEVLRREEGLLEAVVADGVVFALGRPPGFLRASARLVRAGRYRVNVFTGPHAGAARVAHSFFVAADGEGRILECSPPLRRVHGTATQA